jgi:hypothetical protein
MQNWQDIPSPGNATKEQQPFVEDAALRAIVEGVEAETGDQFFPSLVRHLAAALRVQYAFVSPGTVVLPEAVLGFKKGFLLRDPDGHVIQLTEH